MPKKIDPENEFHVFSITEGFKGQENRMTISTAAGGPYQSVVLSSVINLDCT